MKTAQNTHRMLTRDNERFKCPKPKCQAPLYEITLGVAMPKQTGLRAIAENRSEAAEVTDWHNVPQTRTSDREGSITDY